MNRRLIPLLLAILAVYTPCLAAQPGQPAAMLASLGEAFAEHGSALLAIALLLAAAVILARRLYRR